MSRRKQIKYYNGRLQGKYLTESDCDKLESIIKLGEQQGRVPQLKRSIVNLPDEDVELAIVTKSTDLIKKPLGELGDHQTLGVSFMFFAKRALIGDSVGMGKTVEVASLVRLLKQKYGEDFRVLFLAEKTNLYEIQRKLIKFSGEYFESLEGDKRSVEKWYGENQNVVLYDVVGSQSLLNSRVFQEALIALEKGLGKFPFDLVVIDESYILKNSTTQRFKAAKKIADKVEWLVLLNATPFDTDLMDSYNQLSIVDSTFLPTKTSFEDAYVVFDYTGLFPEPSGTYRNQEVFRKQVGYRYFASTRRSTGAKFEDSFARLVRVPLTSEQKMLLQKVSMPQMVYDYPKYFTFFGELGESLKIKALTDLLQGELLEEKVVLVYTIYKDVQFSIKQQLERLGISAEVMNGDTPQEMRGNLIHGFQNAKFKVLITNVMRGLDFGNCDACVFYSYDPAPSRMQQLEGRITRTRDIVGKKSYILCTEGREMNRLKSVISDRAKASESFFDSEFSMVLSLLTESDFE